MKKLTSPIHDDGSRWPAFLPPLILSLLLISCATAPSSRIRADSEAHIGASSSDEQSFPELWRMWTIQIGESRGGGFGFLATPLAGGGAQGPGRGRSQFPLSVTATLMDSTLIESGLRHFADLTEMTPDEETAFRTGYFDRFDPEHHLLIWCDIRTAMAANYLNLDRWTIFIEDNEGDRCEPVQILQEQTSDHQTIMARPLAFQTELGLPPIEIHLKRTMLCFPKRDFYGNLVRWEGVQYLKLVFQQNDDEQVKGEGKWAFKK